MSNYEAKIIKYCSKRILPKGYKINADLRRKLITLVEDAVINYSENGSFFDEVFGPRGKEDVLPCIEAWDVDERICAACANADYLTEEEKLFLLKSFLRRKTEADRSMREQIGFVLSPQIPYQSCVSYLLEHEPLTEEYLLYLLMGDSESPNESFIHNFQIMLNDRNMSDTAKIGYYLCLPNVDRRRDPTKRLKKATSILLDSEAVAKENRVKVFELLREPDLFMQIRKGFEELREVEGTDAGEVYFTPFIEDLFQSLVEMPEELQEEFLRNILNVIDFDFNCVRRQACDWYISQLPTLEEKKEAITRLIENVDCVKSNGDKYIKMCAYDALYSMSEDLDANFVRQLLELGSHSNLSDIRAQCYKYLLLLFDDTAYVEGCLNDTSKKVRGTVVRTALSGTKMDSTTKLRLSKIIEEKKLKLTKKQKGRLKNLLGK